MAEALYRTEDEFGSITVTDDGPCRLLAFADYDMQTCCLKAAPQVLQYEYTQAMLLVLLFCQPKRAWVLGLGGGSLLTALHYHVPGIHITGVELRAAVIDVAYRFFYMPRSKRLSVIQQSASAFLAEDQHRKVDVIFADLYHAAGVDQAQLQVEFIARCADFLKPEGWLVLNCWTEHRENAAMLAALQTHFVDIRTVLTGSRNWVILAGKRQDQQSLKALKAKALQLATPLGFSLTRHLLRLKPLGR